VEGLEASCLGACLACRTPVLGPWLSRQSWKAVSVPCRPVCGVAGIPSSQSSTQHHLQHSASVAALPHCSHAGGAGSPLAYRTQGDASPAILMAPSLQAPQPQEQNGILDWLRKLRLHKYYPVFKQLTMEKVRWNVPWCLQQPVCWPRS
jgi:hypothetical protein